MWKYYKENIGKDKKVVARYYNNENVLILEVKESKSTLSHYSVSKFSCIGCNSVSFRKERLLTHTTGCNPTPDILFTCLKKACELIEQDYKEQLKKLSKNLSILSNID